MNIWHSHCSKFYIRLAYILNGWYSLQTPCETKSQIDNPHREKSEPAIRNIILVNNKQAARLRPHISATACAARATGKHDKFRAARYRVRSEIRSIISLYKTRLPLGRPIGTGAREREIVTVDCTTTRPRLYTPARARRARGLRAACEINCASLSRRIYTCIYVGLRGAAIGEEHEHDEIYIESYYWVFH